MIEHLPLPLAAEPPSQLPVPEDVWALIGMTDEESRQHLSRALVKFESYAVRIFRDYFLHFTPDSIFESASIYYDWAGDHEEDSAPFVYIQLLGGLV